MKVENTIAEHTVTTEVTAALTLEFEGKVEHKGSLLNNVLDALVNETNTKGLVPDEDEAFTVKVSLATGIEALSPIVKNSLFAMVDLFLDYVTGTDVDSQIDNIEEFIIDCYNLNPGQPEYELLQLKFGEEFENSVYFSALEKERVLKLMDSAIKSLINDIEIPTLILRAVEDNF